jgi:Tfp pilus assembly protein PilF
MSLIESGQYQAAAGEAEQVIARLPSHALAHTLRGFAYQQANDLKRAKESFTRALELDPSNANTRQALIEVETRLAESRR